MREIALLKFSAQGIDISTDSSYNGDVAHLNPFRFKGYFYDQHTGLYYLESRYYDPTIRRFINADSVSYVDSETFGGLNLYMYCNNNPVMRVDPTGHWSFLIKAWNAVKDFATNVYESVLEPAVTAVTTFVSDVKSDINNFNWSNTNAHIGQSTNYFYGYQGRLYIEIPSMYRGGLSVGIIFIGPNASANTVKHEYGHTKQLEKMGLLRYLIKIGIPSLTGSILEAKGKLQKNGQTIDYLELPWEHEASDLGGDPDANNFSPRNDITFWDLLKMF